MSRRRGAGPSNHGDDTDEMKVRPAPRGAGSASFGRSVVAQLHSFVGGSASGRGYGGGGGGGESASLSEARERRRLLAMTPSERVDERRRLNDINAPPSVRSPMLSNWCGLGYLQVSEERRGEERERALACNPHPAIRNR